MNKVRAAAPHLKELEPYDPKYLPARVYLNANENPYGIPAEALEQLIKALKDAPIHRYPDPLAKKLRSKIAQINQVPEGSVLLGNGGDELLFDICLAYGGQDRKLLTSPPTFSVYNTDAVLTHTQVVEIPRVQSLSQHSDTVGSLTSKKVDIGTVPLSTPTSVLQKQMSFKVDEQAIIGRVASGDIDIIMLTSPNNPTGDSLEPEFVERLLNTSDALVIIDHAYIEFSDQRFNVTRMLDQHKNLAILRTFSKAYALAGMRIGYMLTSEEVTAELLKVRQPYSVDALAVCAALAVLDQQPLIDQRIKAINEQRDCLMEALRSKLGLPVALSQANYLLTRVPYAHQVWQDLYENYGILLRDLSRSPGLEDCLRATIGTAEQNIELIDALSTILHSRPSDPQYT